MQLATFLVPECDKAGRSYDNCIVLRLKGALLKAYGGWTALGETHGAWLDADGRVEYDTCERFQVGMDSTVALAKLRAMLADLAAEMGQDAIWLTVQTVDGGCVEARRD